MWGEVPDETRTDEQEENRSYNRFGNRNHSETNQRAFFFGFQEDSPHRIFSQGSIIVKANVHSNHILHLHKNAPNADAGGRFGKGRDVRMEMVDGGAQESRSLGEQEVRLFGLPI